MTCFDVQRQSDETVVSCGEPQGCERQIEADFEKEALSA